MDSSDEDKQRRSRLQREKPERLEALIQVPRESTPPPFGRPAEPPRGPSRTRRTGCRRPAPKKSPRKGREYSSSDDDAFAVTPPGCKSKPSSPKGRPKINQRSPAKKKVKRTRGPQSPKTQSKQGNIATTLVESTNPTTPRKNKTFQLQRHRPTFSPPKNTNKSTSCNREEPRTPANSSRRRVETVIEQLSDREVDFPENNDSSGDEAFVTTPFQSPTPTAPAPKRKRGLTIKRRQLVCSPLKGNTSRRGVDTVEENDNVEIDINAITETRLSTTETPQTTTTEHPEGKTRKKKFPVLRQRPQNETFTPRLPQRPCVDSSDYESSDNEEKQRRRRRQERRRRKYPGQIRFYSTSSDESSSTDDSDEEWSPILPPRVSGRRNVVLSSDEEVDPADNEYEDIEEVNFKNDSSENQQPTLRRSNRTRPVNLRIESSASEKSYASESESGSSSSNDSTNENEDRDEVDFDEDLSESNVTESSLSTNNTDSNDDSEDVDIEEELSDNDRPNRIPIPSTKGFQVDWSNIPLKYKVLLDVGERTTRFSEDESEDLKMIKQLFEDYGIDIKPERVFWKKVKGYKGRPTRERYVLRNQTENNPLRHMTFETYVNDKLSQIQAGVTSARYQLSVKTPEQREKRRSSKRQRYKESEKIKMNKLIYQEEHTKFIFYQLLLFNDKNLMELSKGELLQQIRVDPSLQVQSYSGKWICRTPTSSYRTTHSNLKSLCRDLAQSGYRCLQLHLEIFPTLIETEEFESYIIFNENAYREFNSVYGIVNVVPGIRIHSDLVKKAIQLGRIGIKLCRNNEDEYMPEEENGDPYELNFRINADNFRDVTEKIKGRPMTKNSRPEPEAEEFLVYIAVGFKTTDVMYKTKAQLEEILKMKPNTPFHVYVGLWSRLPREKNHGVRLGHFSDPKSKLYKFVQEGGILYAAKMFVCSSLEDAKKLEAFLIMQMFAYADYNPFCQPLNTQYGSILLSSDEILQAINQGSTAEKLFVLSNNNNDPKNLPWSIELDDITSRFHIV